RGGKEGQASLRNVVGVYCHYIRVEKECAYPCEREVDLRPSGSRAASGCDHIRHAGHVLVVRAIAGGGIESRSRNPARARIGSWWNDGDVFYACAGVQHPPGNTEVRAYAQARSCAAAARVIEHLICR